MVISPHHLVKRKLIGRVPSLHHEHASYRWWVLINVMIGTFIAVLDATIVNVGLPKITASFGTSVDKVEWVLTAYLLVFGIMLPASGWVADHYGYKKTYFAALFFFTLGSFLCGVAWNEDALIFFRIIQGIGAGLMMPVGMAIVLREFPPEKRGVALGFWSIAAAASVSFGPLVGGYLIDNIGWHAIFDVNVPIGILAMLATLIIQREYKTEKVRSFDFVGFLSMTVFLTALLLALSEGNAAWNTGGWTSGFMLICFAISLFGLIVFLINATLVEHPFIELALFKNFNFAVTNAVLFIFGISMFGSTFLLPLYLQNSLGYTAVQAGIVFLPVGLLQGIIAPISGLLSDKVNAKIPAIIGIVLLAISLYLNNFLSLFSMHRQIMLPLYIRGFSMGLLFTPLSTLALGDIPRQKIAQASGLFNVIRQVGGSFGVAIFGALLTRRTLYHTAMFGESVNQASPAFNSIVMSVQQQVQHSFVSAGGSAVAAARALVGGYLAQQAFVQAVNDDFFVAAAVSIIAVIPVLFLRTGKKKEAAGAAHSLE
jgi:DHA2 family multidrug resistance protein